MYMKMVLSEFYYSQQSQSNSKSYWSQLKLIMSYLWLYDSIWYRQLVVPSISSFIYGEFYQVFVWLHIETWLIPPLHHTRKIQHLSLLILYDKILAFDIIILKLEIALNLEQS